MSTLLLALASPARRDDIGDKLRRDGHEVLEARHGSEAMRFAGLYEPDLMLLDSDLPDVSGIALCEKLRAAGDNVPIILLIASGREVDGVLGLRAGADDYLVQPVRIHELSARTNAILRRTARRLAPDDVHTIGAVRVDFRRYTATNGGLPLKLTAIEFDLLRELTRRRGEVVARDELLASLWGDAVLPNSRTLDVHVARLRRKIEADPSHPVHLVTVHSKGYRLAR